MTRDNLLPIEREKGPKNLLIRDAEPINLNIGTIPEERSISELIEKGVVNIDKPKNPTSHQVSAWVRDIFGLEKAGHCGTLDPQVTGVLPVALGRATRMVDALLGAGKEYVGIIHLHKEVGKKRLNSVIQDFTGKIYQFPPVKSAVKRQLRVREIYYLEQLEIDGRNVLVKVGCQGGTYIRTLAVDMGDALGVGGHLKELRRTKAGPFQESGCVQLQMLKDAWVAYEENGDESALRKLIMPMEKMVTGLPKIILKDTAVDAICHGADVGVNGISRVETGILVGNRVALLTRKGEVVALGEATFPTGALMKADKGIGIRTTRVLMETKTYPSMWKRSKKD
ncbi:MAG: RNA-guided pseudouridylation complex pseudouridine synthase subunit Cbf5 [Candidatus Thermoplasmatota archaeon]|nr:RNA-guided pseudouridylation complex pseudouridine synthase subunit Cbf5 [Candidatus Thermoplasmatota archaeon]MDP7265881.1 RNA-guided pseudouridylation complex pseudouridine synthase subunit Cbf5 [Candidatus Thermoplasmatota archaeon]